MYLVPAFVGLGAPHWDPHARGAVMGLTRDSGVAHFARAALESVCYQTHDLIQAMVADSGVSIAALRVDGGMVANNWLLQFLSDILDLPVERPPVLETTALGAARLAGLQLGLHSSLSTIAQDWQAQSRFQPQMAPDQRNDLLASWQTAISRIVSAPS